MTNEIWNNVWQETPVEWDQLSEDIYSTLKKEAGNFKGKKILEAGAGSGRISLRMAMEGAQLTLLDYSENALEICRSFFRKYGVDAEYVNADLTKPLPFDQGSFDMVWNAGVMEHFTIGEQITMTSRFSQICSELHTFVPYSGSIFYRLGKWSAEKNGRWRYGIENPISTMKEIFQKSGFELQKEYSMAHLTALDFLAFIPGGESFAKQFRTFAASLSEPEQAELFEHAGGYLLYSKGVKH